MQSTPELVLATPRERTRLPLALRVTGTFLRRKPLGAVGLVLLLLFLAVAILAPVIAPHDPNVGIQGAHYASPSRLYPMGADKFGRDELSRVMHGATISMQVGLFTVLLGVGVGLAIGLVSGYLGGRVDFALQRLVEMFQSLPGIIFALAIITALGRSLHNVVIALAVAAFPSIARVIRANVFAVKGLAYVDAARATGCGAPRIMLRHILPNVSAVTIVLATALLGTAIVEEASLSFLGVGIRPPAPSWGSMVNEATGVMQRYPFLLFFPGIALSLVVFAFNFLGDALRDFLDPRLRRSR